MARSFSACFFFLGLVYIEIPHDATGTITTTNSIVNINIHREGLVVVNKEELKEPMTNVLLLFKKKKKNLKNVRFNEVDTSLVYSILRPSSYCLIFSYIFFVVVFCSTSVQHKWTSRVPTSWLAVSIYRAHPPIIINFVFITLSLYRFCFFFVFVFFFC